MTLQEFCPRCFIGHLRAETATFTRMIDGHMLSVPGARVQICDICGYQDFDMVTMSWLKHLLPDPAPSQPDDGAPLNNPPLHDSQNLTKS